MLFFIRAFGTLLEGAVHKTGFICSSTPQKIFWHKHDGNWFRESFLKLRVAFERMVIFLTSFQLNATSLKRFYVCLLRTRTTTCELSCCVPEGQVSEVFLMRDPLSACTFFSVHLPNVRFRGNVDRGSRDEPQNLNESTSKGNELRAWGIKFERTKIWTSFLCPAHRFERFKRKWEQQMHEGKWLSALVFTLLYVGHICIWVLLTI